MAKFIGKVSEAVAPVKVAGIEKPPDDTRAPAKPGAPPPPTPVETHALKKAERGFTPPQGGKVVETSAQGLPTVYEDPKGERYYTPTSTMWQKGYRTRTQYIEGQRGVRVEVAPDKVEWRYGAPFVAVDGKHITRAEAIGLSKLKGEELFIEQQKLGLIPKGAKYVDPEMRAKAEAALKPYKLPSKKYDIGKAIEDKVMPAYLDIMFGKKVVAQARKELKAIAKAISKPEVKPPPGPTPRSAKLLITRELKRIKAGDILIHKPPTPAELKALSKRLGLTLKTLKERLGLTEAGIKAARKAYLEAPALEVPEGEPPKVSLGLLSEGIARAMADPDPETAKLPFRERWGRAWEAIFEAEKAKVSIGTEGVAVSSTIVLTDLRSQLKDKFAGMPAFIREPSKIVGGLAIGAVIAAPAYATIFTGNLVQCAWAPDKVKAVKDVGIGVGRFFISIPAMVVAEPALAIGELIGMFFIGPEGAIKIAGATKAKLSPHFIPERGIAIEYSVVRVPTRIASELAVMKAVNKSIVKALADPQGRATVKIGDGRIELRLRSTPVSEIVGPALYHATPLITRELIRGKVKGELYTSPQAAPRFADSSAKGTPGTDPAIMMIYPKKGDPKWKPTSVFYKGTKEIEAVYPTIGLTRVKNLNSRIFGAKAGEFITVHKGEAIPIYRFAEPGAVVPRFGIAELLAVRVRTIQATLVDLVKGKKGFEIIKVENLKALRARIAKDIKAEISKVKSYEKAAEIVKRRELERLYRVNPKALERLYRQRGERFEQEYMRYLDRTFREARRALATPTRIRPRMSAREREAITARERFEAERERQAREAARRRITEVRRPLERPLERTLERRITEVRRPLERPPLRRPPPPPPLKPPPKPPLIPLRGASDKEKRKAIADSDGAVAWRQGELKGKDVWHCIKSPYASQDDYLTVLGRKPSNTTLVTGPKSAYETIKLRYGKPPTKKLTGDMGFMDFFIEPKDTDKMGIGFTPDPQSETTGDITIGRRAPPITEKRSLLMGRGRGIRITPKRPRLRR